MSKPRIAIPLPSSTDFAYARRVWPEYAAAIERSGGQAVEIPLDQPPAATAHLLASCQGILLPGAKADVNPQKYGQDPVPECGPADPARENVDELLLQDAHNMAKPILTICFGTQMLNVWRGGSLTQHLTTPINHRIGREKPEAHLADVTAGSLLGALAAAEVSPSGDTPLPLASAEISSSGDTPLPLAVNSSRGHILLRRPVGDTPLPLPVNSSHHQAIATVGDGLRVTARSPEDGVVEAIENAPDGVGGPFVLGVQWHPERSFDSSAASRALFSRLVAEAAAWSPKPNN